MSIDEVRRATLGRTLFVSMTHVLNTVESELKSRHGLTLIDLGCLFVARAAGDAGAPMGSLSARFAVDPSVITYRVKRLADRGLVIRRVSERNRRFAHAVLTPEGAALLQSAGRQLLASADRHFFAHVDDDDLTLLEGVFAAVLSAQESELNPPFGPIWSIDGEAPA